MEDDVSPEATTTARTNPLPGMPEIGRPESFYAKRVHHADKAGDHHLHEAYKVGQYVTLALDKALSWEQKLRYFQHALKRHCQPPPIPDEEVWMFYRKLAGLVKEHCGAEALRMAIEEDENYAMRINLGATREHIEDEAEQFFIKLLGHADHCPDHFNEGDWVQLKLLRDQWI
jgi:hypothetical protein